MTTRPAIRIEFPKMLRWHLAIPATMLLVAGLLSKSSDAGLSAENVIVVVNGKSQVSRTIANHYADLRNIPTNNVVVLEDVPSGVLVGLESFQEKILKPLLKELERRRISPQTRVVAYSAGFPLMVDVKAHRDQLKDANVKKIQLPVASITGATYFYRFILGNSSSYLNLGANFYARGKFERCFANPLVGEKQKEFDEAESLEAEGNFKNAATKWLELHKETPGQSPFAIRASKAFAKSEQPDEAEKALLAAIRSGWWSARYLQEDESLTTIADRPRIVRALAVLDDLPIAMQGPVAFRSDNGWARNGAMVSMKNQGVPYLMSCSLAVIHQRGSTPEQAVKVLKRSAKADRTYPKGRFAFSNHGDIRSKTRAPEVPNALIYLQELGHKTEFFRGDAPAEPGELMGLMTGRPVIRLKGQSWKLGVGSIAENLTSYGGAFNVEGHTKLTEFLHAGAAMSSGPVAEPYAVPHKFPSPMMYGYYARGASAIESFYLSIASPYQTLIVGDPLTQPYAKPPPELVDIKRDEKKSSTIKIIRNPLGLKIPSAPTAAIDICVEGRLVQASPPVPSITMNLPQDASGVFEVRATLIGLDRTVPRLSFIEEIEMDGTMTTPTAEIISAKSEKVDGDSGDGSIKIGLRCKGADSIDLVHLGKVVASIEGDSGEASVSRKDLGGGPLRFRPRAHFDKSVVFGRRIVHRETTK